ncbi:5-methyltetrahydropteroyltriglutamate--homocysteine S-methyltransferase [Thermogemmatispora carboxidivorans]|uniref:5-methyltetrahydropteroyltriglutamate-- homocysteine S-methyltransferase n=1 Tax=Thermogemmatispora carboxidivorans TaxID=1382306 RepID=UPI000699C57E|nr:5-methyltetrahydropteroyltriglutamate--homocysteine S-methyltransferase [Thermogemmatispora carboxidivorans]
MVQATNLGYPRIGAKRELKRALEQFWAGKLDEQGLRELAAALRRQHWQLQQRLGLDQIPANDFSLYDHVLDMALVVGAVPRRYRRTSDNGALAPDLSTYFAMARGVEAGPGGEAVPPMEMTKWFDTNYHYIVPEFEDDLSFHLASTKPLDEFNEARALGIQTRPVLLGPVSFLLLGKTHREDLSPLTLLEQLLPVYEELLQRLAAAGAEWVQLDEPCLVLDLEPATLQALEQSYARLSQAAPQLRLLLATYFGDLGPALSTVVRLPVAAVHLDLVRAPQQLERALAEAPSTLTLSLGIVDGRNVWRTDFEQALTLIEQALARLGSERILLAPSCSLVHVPVDLELESELDAELKQWLAFANQKLQEITLLTRAANEGRQAIAEELERNRQTIERRRTSPRIHNEEVAQRVRQARAQPARRQNPYPVRRQRQRAQLQLPPLPTTTIGSFPQTDEVRAARAAFKNGRLDAAGYEAFLRGEIERTIRFQEEIGLDVLVHGEFERSDMVEYFAEQLDGFLFTRNGWVQSYGSRCVRPPVIYGDVQRRGPMTVRWSTFAQSLTTRPVKGMLTGPVTMMQWSFVRDDQPRAETCYQLALALHDEVQDLEAAGIRIVQIDEPALREGLPLRRSEWASYLEWAVDCFRLVSASVRDETQIHTHMCYAEFGDIIEAIAAMDADVLSIEASRSRLELLNVFVHYRYPNEIGPGVYDVHSPHVPSASEYEQRLLRILEVLPPEQLWVNPDCGLKTRRWEEVRPALAHLTQAVQAVRSRLESAPDSNLRA